LGVFLKIDAGYHRTGIPIENQSGILALISEISNHKSLVFQGFLIHNGHTYSAKGKNKIQEIHDLTLQKIGELKQFADRHQIKSIVSIGDTPAMSVVEDFSFVDEIRPGNFVFYDVMQQNIGSCNFNEIAVALAVPVVAKHPERNEMVVYGGAVHLSKESIADRTGNQIFGSVVRFNDSGWGEPIESTFVKSLSQEHGVIKTTDDFIKTTVVGDFIGILPVHSCLTAHLMREYFTIHGERITTMLSCF
jgi:D-serine deaminase-like pyridoxal phosphate-dependent protein